MEESEVDVDELAESIRSLRLEQQEKEGEASPTSATSASTSAADADAKTEAEADAASAAYFISDWKTRHVSNTQDGNRTPDHQLHCSSKSMETGAGVVDVDDLSSRSLTSRGRKSGESPQLEPDDVMRNANSVSSSLGGKKDASLGSLSDAAALSGDKQAANSQSIPSINDILDLDELNEEQLRAMGEKIALSLARKSSNEENGKSGQNSAVASSEEPTKNQQEEDPLLRKDNQWTERAIGVAVRRSMNQDVEQSATTGSIKSAPNPSQDVSEKDNYESLGAISVAIRESLKIPGAHAISVGDENAEDGAATENGEGPITMAQGEEDCQATDDDTELESRPSVPRGPTEAHDLEQGGSSNPVLYADSMRSSEVAQPEPLVSADLVEHDVVEAQEIGDMATNEELQKEVARKEKRFKVVVRMFSAFCFVLVMAVGLGVLLVLLSGNNDDCPPNNAPFSDMLVQSVKDDINNDRCSPQGRANAWMLKDPNLESYSEARKIQRFVMASAWYSTNAKNTWTNTDHWLSYDVSECEWWTAHPDKNVCDDLDILRVVNLTSNGLRGHIPREALRLLVPRILDLSHNELTGEMPPMAKEMAATVEFINYSNNTLGGKFLVDFGVQGMGLRHFIVRDNQFTGELPVLPMPNLTSMDVSNNRFVGKLPKLLSFLAGLQDVLMADNFLTGTIPREVAHLKNLRIVDLSGNTEMHGTLPTELALVETLQWANVEGTKISGTIPEFFCQRQEEGLLELHSDCANNTLLQCCP